LIPLREMAEIKPEIESQGFGSESDTQELGLLNPGHWLHLLNEAD